ncbi:MAG: arsenate reductase ArsC [Leptospiraceae bacterium]|nr:arsenate reductase ArsC [Leptospiraceae bacterium]
MKNILILCTGNSCRSQMAEGWFRYYSGDKAKIYSAGIETHGLNPNAVKFMKEEGIDISNHTSNHIDEYMDIDFDFIITVCDHAKENCPYIPGSAKRFHQNFSDPSKVKGDVKEIELAFRKTREDIRKFSKNFIEELIL